MGPGLHRAEVVLVDDRSNDATVAAAQATLLPGMRQLTEDEGFPRLEPLRIGLFYKHARLSKAGHGLAQWLMQQITLAGQDLPA